MLEGGLESFIKAACDLENIRRRTERTCGENHYTKRPGVRQKMREAWTDEMCENASERGRRLRPGASPKARLFTSSRLKASWEDPEYREYMTEAARQYGLSNLSMLGDTNPAKTEESRQKIRDSWTDERRLAQAERCTKRNKLPRTRKLTPKQFTVLSALDDRKWTTAAMLGGGDNGRILHRLFEKGLITRRKVRSNKKEWQYKRTPLGKAAI